MHLSTNTTNNSKTFNLLLKKPDMLVVIIGWAYLIIINILFLNVVDYDFTSYVFYIFSAVLVLLFGLSIKRPIKSYFFDIGTSFFTSKNFLIICGLLGFIGSFVIYKSNPYSGIDISIEAIRKDHITQGGHFSYYNYVNILFTPFYPLGIFLATLKRKIDIPIVIFILMLFLGMYFVLMTTGGRADILIIIFIFLSAMIVNKPHYVANHKLYLIMIIIIFLGLNVFYSTLRTAKMRETSIAFRYNTFRTGEDLLKSVGIEDPPEIIAEIITKMWIYAGSSLIYFDNFLNRYHEEPQFGLYHFTNIGNRFESHNRAKVKLSIDFSQANLGVLYNIWATGLREVVVDFGKIMLFPGLFGAGFFIGKLRGLINKYLSARFLYCLLLSWLIALPFVSLFPSRMYENSVILCFIWFLIDIFTATKLHKRSK